MGDLYRLNFIIWPAMHDIHRQHDGIGIHQESAERHQGTDTGGETPARIIEIIRGEDTPPATDGGMDQGPPTIFSGTGTRERYGGFACEIRTGQVLFKEQHQGQTAMKHEETKLQKQIVQWLKIKGFLYTSTGAGLIKNRTTQMIMLASGYYKGCGDLMVFIPNGCLHLELKRPPTYRYSNKLGRLVKETQGGTQSESQKEFQKKIERISGHHYLIANSLSDVMEYIEKNKIKPF